MKNILKLIPIVLLVFTFSCEDDEENRFRNDPTVGWVEFASASTTTGQATPQVSIPLSIRVPVYEDGLNISYAIEPVEGDYTQFVTGNGGTVYADPTNQSSANGDSRALSIDLPLRDMDLGRDFVTSFDVVLTAVDASSVDLGGLTEIVSHRVTIPCSNPDVISETYFVGDYSISDVVATIGPGNGTQNIGTGTVTLSVDPFNPNVRNFDITLLPAFTGGAPYAASIEFSPDDVVTLGGYIGGGISCNGVDEYGYTSAAAADSGPWDVCNDQSIIVNYVEDPNGACGGPYPASFSLTKL